MNLLHGTPPPIVGRHRSCELLGQLGGSRAGGAEFSGQATLHESYDDAAEVYRVSLEVRNRVFGFLFGYEG